MKITFLLLCTLTVFCLKGQKIEMPLTVDNKITYQIDLIQKRNFDTVLSYTCIKLSSIASDEEIKGIGKMHVIGESILIGFKKDRISCIRIVEDFNRIYQSNPIDLKIDSNIQYMRSHVASFEAERFLPFVLNIVSDSVSTIKGFAPVEQGLHEPYYSLYFKYSNKFILSAFGWDWLSEKYHDLGDGPVNLNYKFNTSLHSYKLYSLLIELLAKYENQFDFGK